MTVQSTSNKAVGNGNGATTVWPFNFKVKLATDISVTITDPSGVDSVIPSSAYSVSGLGGTSGSVTYPLVGGALAVGYKITVLRTVDYLQGADLVNQDGFYPEVVEDALDKISMGLQQLAEKISRAVLLPVSSLIGSITIPEPDEGKFLRWIGGKLANATMVTLGAIGIPVAITDGGTGANTLGGAKTSLGIPSKAAQATSDAGTDDADYLTAQKAAVTRQKGSQLWGGVAGGTANALTITLAPAPTAYTAGMTVRFSTGASANTGAATLNANGIGNAPMRKNGVALINGDLPANTVMEAVYYNGFFHVISGGGGSGSDTLYQWACFS
jgi:hypothetical protein